MSVTRIVCGPKFIIVVKVIAISLRSESFIYLLPARASEQGNVIGSVRIYIYIYIYIYVCTKKNCN